MQELQCQHCLKTVSRNDSFTVLDEQLCVACAEAFLEGKDQLSTDDVKQNIDLTICVNCGRDGGSLEYNQVMDFPVCDACAPTFGRYGFPVWIKGAALGLALLVVFSLVWNVRFIQAHFDMEKFHAAMDAGDFQTAADQSESAIKHVPEATYLQYLNDYSAGLALLVEGQSEDALVHFLNCGDYLPPEYQVPILVANSRCYVAFDAYDYSKFLSLAREARDNNPNDPLRHLMVAEALACKYVETGDELFQTHCREILDAVEFPDDDEQLVAYQMGIEHRLFSKTIISQADFTEQFPDGWHEPGEGE